MEDKIYTKSYTFQLEDKTYQVNLPRDFVVCEAHVDVIDGRTQIVIRLNDGETVTVPLDNLYDNLYDDDTYNPYTKVDVGDERRMDQDELYRVICEFMYDNHGEMPKEIRCNRFTAHKLILDANLLVFADGYVQETGFVAKFNGIPIIIDDCVGDNLLMAIPEAIPEQIIRFDRNRDVTFTFDGKVNMELLGKLTGIVTERQNDDEAEVSEEEFLRVLTA